MAGVSETGSRGPRPASLADHLSAVETVEAFGRWHGDERVGDVTQLGWFEPSAQGDAFIAAAYDLGWVRPSIPWMRWQGTPEGRRLLADPDALATAGEDEVAAVLTAVIRGERFGDGVMADAVEGGVLAAAVRRTKVLDTSRTTVVIERIDGGPRLVIERADLFAAHYFDNDEASIGPDAFDDYVGTSDPVRVVRADIQAINRTMRARSPYEVWQDFLDTAEPLPWLVDLPLDVSLFDHDDRAWEEQWAERVETPIGKLIGNYRNLAVVTKVLHAKRPHLFPVLDSLVVQQVGGTGEPALRLLDHIRHLGRLNGPTLRAIGSDLAAQGRPRSEVRILDALTWASHPAASLEFEPGQWERRVVPSPLYGDPAD